ncbi:MAG TPA: hypothetical protein VHP11_02950, partial [Tepidisphaeraceae bacterium]|nr:hypothetical protein [Tepidisphaeraceae bacterium]
HNTAYFKRYDLSITGFVIDGFAPNMGERGLDEYMKFSPDGLVFQHPRPAGLHKKTLPYVAMATDLDGDPKDAGPRIVSLIGQKTPCFLSIRTILKSPTWHKRTIDAAVQTPGGQQLRFVDPYTFFLLVKQSQQ